MQWCNHVLLIHTRAWHDDRMQAVCDPDLTLHYFPRLNVLPATCPGNVPIQSYPPVSRLRCKGRWLAVCVTRYLLQDWDVLQVAPIFQHLHLWRKLVKHALWRHQTDAVPEVLHFEVVLSDPIFLSPQEVALKQLSARFLVCCKQRPALPGILETFVT